MMSVKSSESVSGDKPVMDDGALQLSLGTVTLQSGESLYDAKLVVKTFGTLNTRRDNTIVIPTSFGATHKEFEWMIGPDSLFDPARYFIVIANLFGNGLSTAPSNSPNFARTGKFPEITAFDNALCIQFVMEQVFGVRKIYMAIGWSMGGQVAYHLAALFPGSVERLVPICASAQTSPHNTVFLEGAKAVLTTDIAYDPESGWFTAPPQRALRALGRFYAGWALSQGFYRSEVWQSLGYTSVEDFLQGYWEHGFTQKDANNLLCHISTWKLADISANPLYDQSLTAALGAIRADVLLMPCKQDLYFRVADSETERLALRTAELSPLQSVWGHRAGNPALDADGQRQIRKELRRWLGQSQL